MSKRHTLGVSKWLPSTKDKISFKITLRPSKFEKTLSLTLWPLFLARRCHHEKELEKKDIMNQAATLIQAIARGFLERRRHAKRVKEEEEAEAKRRAEEEALFLRMKSAAKKMQRWWRKISMRMLSAISVVLGFQHFEKTPDLVDCFRGKKLIQKLFNIFSSRRDYCSPIFWLIIFEWWSVVT